MTANIKIYQIAYDSASLQEVQGGGFYLLDNLSNERPDWYEYWPIRKYLLQERLDDSTYYGFFSPKFSEKTQWGHANVQEFINNVTAKECVDVVLFCPQPDMGANFLNVFEQAEVFDHGFIEAAASFLSTQGISVPLESLVMDSRQIVYSNYFVAKASFWRIWFAITEALFDMAENSAHPLYEKLNTNTSYALNANRKVFLIERIASLLLYLHPDIKVAAANPFDFGWSMARFRDVPHDTYINDALKRAFRDTGFPQYMDAFRAQREKLIGAK